MIINFLKRKEKVEKKKIKISFTQVTMLLFAIIALLIFASITSPYFFTARNLLNIFTQATVLGLLSLGAGMVMISGGIDLTVGDLISFIACTVAVLISNGVNVVFAVLIGIVISVLCGAITGFIITKSKAEPFIITLGLALTYKGLALITANGNNIALGPGLSFLGRGEILQIPVPVLIFIVVFIIVFILMKYTKFGRRAYSIGGNVEAAYLTGIKVDLYKVIFYTVNGLIAGLSSLVMLSRVGSASPVMGSSYSLQAIAAVVIGGISLSGGKGSIFGTFLGVLLLGIVSNILNLLNISSFYQSLTLGLVIVIAVIISKLNAK